VVGIRRLMTLKIDTKRIQAKLRDLRREDTSLPKKKYL